MRVLMTSTSFPESPEDWKGRFIANLVAALSQRDDLSLSLWAPPGHLPEGAIPVATATDNSWLARLSRQGGVAHVLRNRKVLATCTVISLLFRLGRAYRQTPADVFHINWLQNALPLLGTKTPALIAVLGTDFALLRLPGMKALLRTVLKQRRAILAPNAVWMQAALEQAFGGVAEIHPILFGVDEPWFEVVRQPMADGTHHWLAVTRLTKNKIGDLFDWGEGLFGEKRRLHLFGPMQEDIAIPSWVDYHGPTHPKALLEDWFPKASGLITLSRHDEGRPQIMLEAMAARLPILASDLPAHRDMLRHKKTGWLASSRKDAREGLEWLEDPARNLLVGNAGRNWILNSVGTWKDCADRYAAAYRQLLEPEHATR